MEPLEISARTVEEATQIALSQLGVRQEEVNVTVLSEGKTGILGLGSEEARVRVELLTSLPPQESDVARIAQDVLEKLINLLGVEGSVLPEAHHPAEGVESTASTTFNVTGEDLGILIGRRGQTLTSLQYIVRLIVGHQTKNWAPITIDVEGYKQRRYESLQALANRMAEQVKIKGTPFTLEPMPAYERRIIHLTLADHPDVTTESIGVGESRKVVIHPETR